ncbi:hypothetical protein L211DRAFT_487525 [Terfezia boudieri ATCC MYA-4762]|uniref:Uncharacterized protein n=1 Tax=Terfezia boudieri ATCC MYA-4762 TaxID=1051890 RepID=A0A3N4LDB2_9PEZI|nr:hypothetical protein L211DRAFT_487525 [Terfezia boudieri ATCC MYA-4762]
MVPLTGPHMSNEYLKQTKSNQAIYIQVFDSLIIMLYCTLFYCKVAKKSFPPLHKEAQTNHDAY